MITEADLANSLFSAGGGTVIGFAIGYALKKLLKIAIIVIGVFFTALAYLASIGWLSVNWPHISAQVTSFVNATSVAATSGQGLEHLAYSIGLPAIAGMSIGFALGFTKG